jgi:hypothetical protein
MLTFFIGFVTMAVPAHSTYVIITTVYGNASLWGMLLAPFCIRKWGKKNVQIVTNLFNIIFILCMYPFFLGTAGADGNIKNYVIWAVMACLYLNAVVGAFAHILNPSIQADIRDYQQYKTGERIDGMFAAVATIGGIITLITAGVLPALQEKYGMTAKIAEKVTSDTGLMSRVLPGAKQTLSQMLTDQLANGQNNFVNPSSALYDVNNILLPLLRILVIVAAVGATLNVIPFFFYDLTERKQKSYVRVLKVRAVFEDYGNNAMKDKDIVEMIDLVNNAKEMAVATPKKLDKSSYKGISDKNARKEAKKAYKADVDFNEEIEISKFVVDELNKFDTELGKKKVEVYQNVLDAGLDGIKNASLAEAKGELKSAKALPKSNLEEKEERKFFIELARSKVSAVKAYNKYFGSVNELRELDFAVIDDYFAQEDSLDDKIAELAKLSHVAKKDKDADEVKRLKAEIKKYSDERKEVRNLSKAEMDKHAQFNRAAKPYVDAKKVLTQYENFQHLDEIAAQYDEAKARAEAEEKAKELENERKRKELEAELAKRKAARKKK